MGGFDQNLDSDPGSSNYYLSPTGDLTFSQYLSGAQRQGKHTAYVRAWSGDKSQSALYTSGWYGYDALPPTVAITSGQSSGSTFTSSQSIAFHVSDPDSGLAGWSAAWDSDPGQKQSSASDGSLVLPAGTHTLHVHAWDNVGNSKDWSFGPFTYQPAQTQSGWKAISISTAANGDAMLLWTKPDGSATFGDANRGDDFPYGSVYGPYSGWTARKIAAAPNGVTDIFWTNSNGSASYWTVHTSGAITYSPSYGPYNGWTPKDFAEAPDGSVRLLWTNASNAASYWTIASNGSIAYSPVYGPYAGWTATNASAAPGGITQILWANINGAASYWTVSSNRNVAYSPSYGPYNGWQCAAIGIGGDGKTRLQWNSGGSTSFWTIDMYGYVSYSPAWGPFSGWSPTGFVIAPDGSARLLWDNTNGAASTWAIMPRSYDVYYGPTLGPY